MKRSLALRYAREIADRLHRYNGIIGTPNATHKAVVVKRVWVFGSSAKGAERPNDLDLLIECNLVKPYERWCRGRKLDRKAFRIRGWKLKPSALNEFLKWLSKGMRKVSRHVVGHETIDPTEKRLIYPKWDL